MPRIELLDPTRNGRSADHLVGQEEAIHQIVTADSRLSVPGAYRLPKDSHRRGNRRTYPGQRPDSPRRLHSREPRGRVGCSHVWTGTRSFAIVRSGKRRGIGGSALFRLEGRVSIVREISFPETAEC